MPPAAASVGANSNSLTQLTPRHRSAALLTRYGRTWSLSYRHRTEVLRAITADEGGHHDFSTAATPTAPRTRKELWMAAIKPPMYSVGIIPVLVGAAAAYAEHGIVSGSRVVGFVFAAICVIAWLNLSNDAFDAETGVDKHKAESVVNLTGNRNGVLLLAMLLLAVALALIGTLLSTTGDWRSGGMLAAAIMCGYLYQGPPFRFSYKGWGEYLCFVAFGPLAVPAFYLALLPPSLAAATPSVGASALRLLPQPGPVLWLLSVLVGITTSTILFCSHFHQIEGDLAAGKMSPLVRLGTHRACQVLRTAVAAPYVFAAAGAAAGVLSPIALLATALSLPAARKLVQFATDNHTVPALVMPLKKYGCIWHSAFGLSLVLGLVLGRVGGI